MFKIILEAILTILYAILFFHMTTAFTAGCMLLCAVVWGTATIVDIMEKRKGGMRETLL